MAADIPIARRKYVSVAEIDPNVSLDITHVQQGILKKVYGDDSLSKIPQMWCMYKEVAEYFVNGVSLILGYSRLLLTNCSLKFLLMVCH